MRQHAAPAMTASVLADLRRQGFAAPGFARPCPRLSAKHRQFDPLEFEERLFTRL